MELERIVLISNAIARSKAEAERQRSAEQARESIPEFRRRLSGLILANVVQKTEIIEWKVRWPSEKFNKDIFDTRLECGIIIPDDPERVKVVISSSGYPESGRNPTFEISVEENDSRLIIDQERVSVVSKAIDSNVPSDPMRIVIGGKCHSWPIWEREATMEDVKAYSDLLEVIENGDVEFSGKTPTKYIVTPPKPSLSEHISKPI